MPHILVATLDDEPGALDRVASLFRRRAFNIHSLTVNPSEEPGCSRMTLVVDAEGAGLARAKASLEKLVSVRRVEEHPERGAVVRDLALVRVKAGAETRPQVLQLAQIFRAQVVDLAADSLVLECTGARDKLDRFVDALRPFGLLELGRSCAVAMARGAAEADIVPFAQAL